MNVRTNAFVLTFVMFRLIRETRIYIHMSTMRELNTVVIYTRQMATLLLI